MVCSRIFPYSSTKYSVNTVFVNKTYQYYIKKEATAVGHCSESLLLFYVLNSKKRINTLRCQPFGDKE